MVWQDGLETNLSQLSAHPENSERVSMISVIIFEVKIVAEHANATITNMTCALLRSSKQFCNSWT